MEIWEGVIVMRGNNFILYPRVMGFQPLRSISDYASNNNLNTLNLRLTFVNIYFCKPLDDQMTISC